MTESLELQLVKEFPSFFRDYKGDMMVTCMAWGMEHGDGWFTLFYELNQKIHTYIQVCVAAQSDGSSVEVPDFYWSQVKEKYGTARWYYEGGDDVISDLVAYAEQHTASTCEQCGELGRTRGKGWYYTACDAHVKDGDKDEA